MSSAAGPRGVALRARLAEARLMLCYTPEAVSPGRDALAALEAALPFVDAVQVRPKPRGGGAGAPPGEARATWEHARALLARLDALAMAAPPLVLVNDRVDVALALLEAGVAGCHLGQDDQEPGAARALLGEDLLLGLSTHGGRQVARAALEPVDYLGFGPVYASATKGYAEGLGPEAAWVAAAAVRPRPVFPIGGIDASNAAELASVGRAAVTAAILDADDPARAARQLRAALGA